MRPPPIPHCNARYRRFSQPPRPECPALVALGAPPGYEYFIYDRDVPQFPLAIDHYGAHVHLQEFDTGWQQSDAEHEAWVSGVVAVVGETLGLPAARIHFKRRERQRGMSQYQKLRDVADEFEVTEGSLASWSTSTRIWIQGCS